MILKIKKIDHKNGNGLDNRLKNLRIATESENSRNQNKRRTNKSGFKGVSWGTRDNKWRSYITINGKFKSLGYYSSKEDAAKAYDKAAIKYFGEFAKTNY